MKRPSSTIRGPLRTCHDIATSSHTTAPIDGPRSHRREPLGHLPAARRVALAAERELTGPWIPRGWCDPVADRSLGCTIV